MPLVDNMAAYGEEVTPFLTDGERLLWVMPFQLAYGPQRLGETPADAEPPPRLSLAARIVHAVVSAVTWPFRVLTYPVTWLWQRVDWEAKLVGVTASGATGSLAYQIAAVDEDHHDLFAAVTDQRLLVLDQADGRYQLLLEVPPDQVAGAERHGRPLHRGRVVVAFTDGSQIALMAGMFSTSAARRFIAALDASH